jgi:outer membrane protein assembly factor BamB
MRRFHFLTLPVYGLLLLPAFGGGRLPPRPPTEPLNLVVMDPLAAELACACVAGYAQRDYGKLADFLEQQLNHPVSITLAESLFAPAVKSLSRVDMVVGKHSEIKADARAVALQLRTMAMLSDLHGHIHQTGLFVVRGNDPAQRLEDLAGYKMLFGPAESIEKQAAAFAALEAFGLPLPDPPDTSPACSSAALAIIEKEADCAVVSSYAMPLLEGCGSIEKGELRVIGRTDPVPFIAVFINADTDPEQEQALRDALSNVRKNKKLLATLESRDGFIPLEAPSPQGWPDWRGPNRDAISPDVPEKLPKEPRLLWSRIMIGNGMAGLSVAEGCVFAADKSLEADRDIFHCLDMDTGVERWRIEYPARGEMDFTNSPRANSVIHKGKVYLLGAFGDLFCVEIKTGSILWKKNLAEDFDTAVPSWGFCSTPLVVDDKLIVNPGAPDAALVALDLLSGEIRWKTAGENPGYSSFIMAAPQGVRQIVGYDAISAGGWDPDTGKRLWSLFPPESGDFNVPTPIMVGERLLLSTENNGTRLYAFTPDGILIPEPQVRTEELNPDTSTPVLHNGLVFGNWSGLVCLDADDLKLNWATEGGPLADYCSFIAGNGRILATTQIGELFLVKADRKKLRVISHQNLFPDVSDTERDVWSHPALVGNRLYIRNSLAAYCFMLD